ncbi:MAG TPA: Trk system potassium transporter TrkA [Pyrinomonadaceae bacterium]|nr:Trk system potassium transporter TrkA [Pyrinomonadaceae bacterium]
MRIIIAGGGEIGYQLASRLTRDHDVVVVEQEAEALNRFERLDLQAAQGSPAHPDTLRRLNLAPSDTFIACSESDEVNVISCLSAKRLGAPRTFCFVTREEYYRSLCGDEGSGGALLDIDQVIWPQHMLAEEIARVVLVPRAIDVEFFAGGRVLLLEYRLRPDSPLVGRPLSQLKLPRGVLAVAVSDGDRLTIPSGQTVFREGQKVVFMGEDRALFKLQHGFIPDAAQKIRDVTIIGGGTVGLTLAKLLLQREKLSLKLVEISPRRCERLAAELPSALILNGDGTDLELFEAEQLHRSDVLVSVTTNDEKNLLATLLARQMQVPKIITRVDKPRNLRLFESVGIDVPLNMRFTAVETVLNSLLRTDVQLRATVEHGKADVLEVVVPEGFVKTTLREMPTIEGAVVGAIVRRNSVIVPHGEDVVKPGDRLFVFSTDEAADKVRNYF